MEDAVVVGVVAIAGTLVGAVFACVPGLHVYNIMALVVLVSHWLATTGTPSQAEIVVPLMISLTVAWAMVNTIPSTLLAAPDESALFTVLPGQKFLMMGRGYEGTMITGAGGLVGAFILVVGAGCLAPKLLPPLTTVFRPHTHWVLWTVICFMLMSEWPKGGRLGHAGWKMFFDGWKNTGPGLVTFLLAGLLGFVLLYRSPIAADSAFQNLMPAFVGLFTIPWLLLNLVSGIQIPQQRFTIESSPDRFIVLQGAFAGGFGGGFAAFFPVMTGGIGGFLAGHATALRDDRVFLASQGASKFIYYAGGLLFFFVPGVHLTRGGAAWMIKGLHVPHTYADFYMALACVALSAAVSFLLLGPLTRATITVIQRVSYQRISFIALLFVVALVHYVTGFAGLYILVVATGIGLLPVLYGSRRMNCLSVILLPMACNMSGVGSTIAGWLGLL